MVDYFLGNGKWILEIIAGLLALVLLNAVVRYGVRALLDRPHLLDEGWRSIIERAFWGPFHLLLAILGLSYVIRLVLHQAGLSPVFYTVGKLRDLGILASVTWFIVTAVQEWRRRVLSAKCSKRKDRANADLIAKLLSALLWVPIGLMFLDILGMPLGGLAVLGTVAGGTVAFAARDVTSSLLGGIALYLSRPFVVGDRIAVPERKLEGVVEEIGWCMTQIRTDDARPIFVPNALFMASPQENLTRQSHRLIKEVLLFRVVERENLQTLLRTLQEVLAESPDLDPYMKRVAHIRHNGPHGLEIEIAAYTREVDELAYYRIRTAILMRAMQAVEKLQAPLVYELGDVRQPEVPEC